MEVFMRHSWAVQIRSLRAAPPAGFSFLPGSALTKERKSRVDLGPSDWIWTPLLYNGEQGVVIHSACFFFSRI